jgi:hypothetical protein
MSKIEYYTIEGNLISFEIDRCITLSSIDKLAILYVENTNRYPTQVFIRCDLYSILMRDMANITGYQRADLNFPSMVSFNSSVGNLEVIALQDAYVPLLVGNHFEYDNNNVNRVFEEVVLNV